jgi:hypothetical protein
MNVTATVWIAQWHGQFSAPISYAQLVNITAVNARLRMNNRHVNRTLPPAVKPRKPLVPYFKPGVEIVVPLTLLPQVLEVNDLEVVETKLSANEPLILKVKKAGAQ